MMLGAHHEVRNIQPYWMHKLELSSAAVQPSHYRLPMQVFTASGETQVNAHLEAEACQPKAWRGDDLKAAIIPHQLSREVPKSYMMPAKGLETFVLSKHVSTSSYAFIHPGKTSFTQEDMNLDSLSGTQLGL